MNLVKVAGHKINAQKSLAFLYTNNERSKREIKETIPFTIPTKSGRGRGGAGGMNWEIGIDIYTLIRIK